MAALTVTREITRSTASARVVAALWGLGRTAFPGEVVFRRAL